MRYLRVIVVAALVLVLSATAAFAATKNVGVRKSDSKFKWSVSTLRIKKGDTVKWSWRGNIPHNVTGPGFHSRTANKLTYSRRFNRTGRFRVVCTIHSAQGQRMTVIVR
jgi:plastocyanin